MSSPETAAAEYTPSLVDVLQQLELPAAESLIDQLACYRCISRLRLTCRALRDLMDTSVGIPKVLSLELRADGTVAQPLACLERWGRRGGICLELEPSAEGGVDTLLPAAFAGLPEAARQRVWLVYVVRRRGSRPAVSGAAVGALAALLPGLRKLILPIHSPTGTPGDKGEAFAALAALGTLEELQLSGVPGLTGVEALAGSLRRLELVECRLPAHPLTVSAAAPLGQLTRLEALDLAVSDVDLGEGPTLRNLLALLPHSLGTLKFRHRTRGLDSRPGLDGTFGLAGGRLMSAELRWLRLPQLAALAQNELLPCLGPDGRLGSLGIDALTVDGWNTSNLQAIRELWCRTGKRRVDELCGEEAGSAADVCSALMALGPISALRLVTRLTVPFIKMPLQLRVPPPVHGSAPDLPPPEEVLRMALQRLAPPGAGGKDGAASGRPEAAADEEYEGQLLLLRGPAATPALARPHSRAAVEAWAKDLESRARAAAGDATPDGVPLFAYVQPFPPASAVALHCTNAVGAAEAVAAAVAAAGDGSEAVRVRTPCYLAVWDTALAWGLRLVMGELWAASAGEGGPGLERRVEWAIAVQHLVKSMPLTVAPWGYSF